MKPTENLSIELDLLYILLKNQVVKKSTELPANFTNIFSAFKFIIVMILFLLAVKNDQ